MVDCTRRKLLATIGAGVAGSIAGCSRVRDRSHVVLSMSKRLRDDLTEVQQSETFEVCERYIIQALDSRFEDSVEVEFDDELYEIESDDAKGMLDDFEGSVSGKKAEVSHICLCSDVSGKKSSGRAEIQENNCDIRSEGTNLGVVTAANRIHNRSGLEAKPALRVRDSEIFDHYFANYALGVLIHEIGHNLCLEHDVGQAWYGANAPEIYNPVRDEENIYLSPMLGFYYYERGGLPSLEDEETEIPTFTGTETIHYGTVFPPSTE